MKLGFLSAILDGWTYEEMMDTAHDFGFKCVEVACWPKGKAERRYAGVSHIDAERVNVDDEYASHILSYAKERGVEISSLGYYPNPLDSDEEKRKMAIDHLMALIDASAKLNVNMVTTFIGRDQNKDLEENLALVKEIVGSLGGDVYVDSVPGKGSSFTVKLPLVRAVSKVSERRPANVGRGGGNKPQILVVEDNKSVADYIAGLFAGSFGVSVASNGEDGFSMALDIVPDLIITDLMMPGTDGFEFCRNVRNNEVIDHIPIIIVTAKIQQKERMRGFEAGADAFLTKPFDSDELRILVDNQLERHRNLRMKFSCNGLSSAPVGEEQMSEQENRFLAKASDIVLSLMESRRLDVPTIAQKLCMSPRQLHRKIVTLTGAPPSSFILNVRMQRACALMRAYPGWTVEEIADKCGFDHVTSFYHSFKKVYGLTPSEYRRKML